MLAQLSNFIIEISLRIGQLLILKLRMDQNSENVYGVFRQNWEFFCHNPGNIIKEDSERL